MQVFKAGIYKQQFQYKSFYPSLLNQISIEIRDKKIFSLGIPIVPPHRAIHFALNEKAQPLDMMRVNRKHYALVAAGQGYDAIFMKGANRKMKRKYGFFAYFLSFLRTFFTYYTHPYKIVVDGQHLQTAGKLAIIFNVLSLTGLSFGKDKKPYMILSVSC